MSSRDIKLVVSMMLLVLVVLPTAMANVVVFDSYKTSATVRDDVIHIERTIRMKNIGQSPIIPGELHFRLYEEQGANRIALPVSNLQAQHANGKVLDTKVFDFPKETDLSVQVWDPLLPGFFFDFTMSYDLEFSPSGLLFHEIVLPQEETTIPIRNQETQFFLSDGYHVTYAPDSSITRISGNAVVAWENGDSERVVEYSRLPFPSLGVRGVNAFWALIIIALIAALVLSIKRQRNIKSKIQANELEEVQRQYHAHQQAHYAHQSHQTDTHTQPPRSQ